jgi:hypothetical protein
MATIRFTKDADEVLDFLLDWSKRLVGGDVIATSEWIMPTPVVGDIEKDSDSMTDTTTTIWVSGGTTGKSYQVVNRVETSGGRIMDQTCAFKIKAR